MNELTEHELWEIQHALEYRAKVGGWSMYHKNSGQIEAHRTALEKVTRALEARAS